MNLVDIDEFMSELKSYAPSVPDPVAHRHLRNAARDFCKRTRIWRDSDTITVTEPHAEGVTTIQDAEIYEIERADFGDDKRPLRPVSVHELDRELPQWRNEEVDASGEGHAQFITQLFPDTIAVVPRATGMVIVHCILMPSRSALSLPEILLSQHAETIGAGAAAKALRIPNTEYANPNLAMSLRADFERETATARTLVEKTLSRARQRTKGSWF